MAANLTQEVHFNKTTELFLEQQCDRAAARQSILEIDKFTAVKNNI